MEQAKLLNDQKFIILFLDKENRFPSFQVMKSIEKWSARANDDN